MGDKVWDWFLPIRGSKGNGINFEYNEMLVKKLQKKARNVMSTQASRAGKAPNQT